jgi:hypothetical protein
MADLCDGMTVLDLGSGGGIDVLLSARRVPPPAPPVVAHEPDDDVAPGRSWKD